MLTWSRATPPNAYFLQYVWRRSYMQNSWMLYLCAGCTPNTFSLHILRSLWCGEHWTSSEQIKVIEGITRPSPGLWTMSWQSKSIILLARGHPSWYFICIVLFSCKIQFRLPTLACNVIISIKWRRLFVVYWHSVGSRTVLMLPKSVGKGANIAKHSTT